MIRFYFDTINGELVIKDDIGKECLHLGHARVEGLKRVTEMAREWLPTILANHQLGIRVRNSDRLLMEIGLDLYIREYFDDGFANGDESSG